MRTETWIRVDAARNREEALVSGQTTESIYLRSLVSCNTAVAASGRDGISLPYPMAILFYFYFFYFYLGPELHCIVLKRLVSLYYFVPLVEASKRSDLRVVRSSESFYLIVD